MALLTLERLPKKSLFSFGVIFFSLFLFPSFFLVPGPASAQTSRPDIILSWRAETYTPPFFSGKALPINRSSVVVSLDVLVGGKILDLSSQQLEWYVNDAPFRAGVGLRRISIAMPDLLGSRSVSVGVRIPDYGDGSLEKTIAIPTASPKVVITHPYPKNNISSSFSALAVPYFFNVSSPLELAYLWDVNDEAPSGKESPRVLSVQLPRETPIGALVSVMLTAQNKNSSRENALAVAMFTKTQ